MWLDLWPMALVLLWMWAIGATIHSIYREGKNMLNLLKTLWNLLGRNQWLLLYFHTLVIVASIFAVWLSKTLTADVWLEFIWKYGLGVGASFALPSATMKTAGILKNGKKPADTSAGLPV